jgi:hypothetical protein
MLVFSIVFWTEFFCFVFDIDWFIGDFIGDAGNSYTEEKKETGRRKDGRMDGRKEGMNASELETHSSPHTAHRTPIYCLYDPAICPKLLFPPEHLRSVPGLGTPTARTLILRTMRVTAATTALRGLSLAVKGPRTLRTLCLLPCHDHRDIPAYGGKEVQLHAFLISALHRGGWSASYSG